jgi:hypothetical protein
MTGDGIGEKLLHRFLFLLEKQQGRKEISPPYLKIQIREAYEK